MKELLTRFAFDSLKAYKNRHLQRFRSRVTSTLRTQFAVRYTTVRVAETCPPIMKALSLALLSQLHPGHSTEALAKAKVRKNLRRGPEYRDLLVDPERERGLSGLYSESLTRFSSSL